MTRGEANNPNRPNHPPRSPPVAAAAVVPAGVAAAPVAPGGPTAAPAQPVFVVLQGVQERLSIVTDRK